MSPVLAPLIGLLLVAAVVAVAWRTIGRGPSRIRRAMVTVGGGLIAVWLLGMLLQACGTHAVEGPAASTTQR